MLTGFVLPLRHYEQGAQLILTNANRFGYGTTVTQAACVRRLRPHRQRPAAQPHRAGAGRWRGRHARRGQEELALRAAAAGPAPDDRGAAGRARLGGRAGGPGPARPSRCTPCCTSTSTSGPCSGVPGPTACSPSTSTTGSPGTASGSTPCTRHGPATPATARRTATALGEIVARWYPRSSEAVRTYAGGIAELAGSGSILGAAERSFAELAASLTKVGVPVPTTEGAQA